MKKIITLLLSLFLAFNILAQGVSTLIDAGGVLTTKANISFAKVYKRKVNGVDTFVWYTVNANGGKLVRGNRIKNTPVYSTLSAAEAAIPASYLVVSSGGGASGTIEIVNQFAKGITGDASYQIDNNGSIWYAFGNEFTQMSIVPQSNYHVAVTATIAGWGNGTGTLKYKVENSPNWLTKAELEAIDFSNMKGRDISIYGAAFLGSVIEETRQAVIHFAGDNTSKVPSFYKRASTNRLPQLPYIFPDFSMPSSKTNIMQFGQLNSSFEYQNQNYLTKGFTVVDRKFNNSIPISKNIVSNYDTWAYSHGCPKDSAAKATTWLANQSMINLYTWFYNDFISPASNNGAAMVDFEAWYLEILGNQDACNKMATLFRAFKNANPNTVLMSYVGSRGYAATATFSGINATERDNEAAKYSQTASQVRRQFEAKTVQYLNINSGTPDGTSGYLSEYLDVINCGDYQHFLSHSWLYSTIQEAELAKTHRPNKKAMALMWSYIEPVSGSDFNSVGKAFKKSDNTTYYKADYKPAAPFSILYNTTAWLNFIGDGVWFWHDPYAAVEGFDFHGWFGKNPTNGEKLPYDFSPNSGAAEISTTIGYDYAALALYELSFNADILNGTQPILKPEFSINSGSSYYTSNDLLPSYADFLKIPLVRIKKHPTLNEWLILAVNRYNEAWINQTIRVKIPNTTEVVDLVLNGQFTNISRVKLN